MNTRTRTLGKMGGYMGYNAATVDSLTNWLGGFIPRDGAILELGEQQINGEIGDNEVAAVRRLIARATAREDLIEEDLEYFLGGRKRIADAFRNSTYLYRCLDIAEGEGVIRADLNHYSVPAEWRERFDVVTNQGTTEHVGNQFNAFRAIHDFAKSGARLIHQVPFSGYYNHGLYCYSPAFFIFLAQANNYDIEQLDLTAPHLPYTIPVIDAMPGTRAWEGIHQQSGLLSVRLRKNSSEDFVGFSDYDAHLIGRAPLAEPWASIIANRYDLRVR